MISTDENAEGNPEELIGSVSDPEGIFEAMMMDFGMTSMALSPDRGWAKVAHDSMTFTVQVPHPDASNYRGTLASSLIGGAFSLADTPVGLPLAPI